MESTFDAEMTEADVFVSRCIYSVSQKNTPHKVFWHFFPKRLGIF